MTDCIGLVSSEGGPFIVGDLVALLAWKGIDTDDYDLACKAVPDVGAAILPVAGHDAAVWSMGAVGGAYVFRMADGGVRIVRAEDEKPVFADADAPSATPQRVGTVRVDGTLVVVWGPESMAEISWDGSQLVGEFSMGHTALLVPNCAGEFAVLTDVVESMRGTATRLIFAPLRAVTG